MLFPIYHFSPRSVKSVTSGGCDKTHEIPDLWGLRNAPHAVPSPAVWPPPRSPKGPSRLLPSPHRPGPGSPHAHTRHASLLHDRERVQLLARSLPHQLGVHAGQRPSPPSGDAVSALSDGLSFNSFQKGNSESPGALGGATATRLTRLVREATAPGTGDWGVSLPSPCTEQKSRSERPPGLLHERVGMFLT